MKFEQLFEKNDYFKYLIIPVKSLEIDFNLIKEYNTYRNPNTCLQKETLDVFYKTCKA